MSDPPRPAVPRKRSQIDDIVNGIANCFPVFGGGRCSAFNPIAAMMKDKPLMFAMGVDVRAVVEFVLETGRKKSKKRGKR